VKEKLPRIRRETLLNIYIINTPKKGKDELPVQPELLVEYDKFYQPHILYPELTTDYSKMKWMHVLDRCSQ